MTSFTVHYGVETLTDWLRDQQEAAAAESQALEEAEPADAVARLLLGAGFAISGYLLIQSATAVSGQLVINYELAGRVAASVIGLLALRVGAPRVLSGLRTVKKVRAGEYADDEESVTVDDVEATGEEVSA